MSSIVGANFSHVRSGGPTVFNEHFKALSGGIYRLSCLEGATGVGFSHYLKAGVPFPA